MKCSQAILLMEKSGQGKTAESTQKRLGKHLQDCPECAAFQSRRREMANLLAELRQPVRQENGKTCGNT